MPDWRALIRGRLAGSGLDPTTEIDVIEELAQHVEDCYDELRRGGVAEADAEIRSLAELDGHDLLPSLLSSLAKES